MSTEITPPSISPDEIGVAVITMEDMGPQTHLNLSCLDEISSMYLAVKGFTAFMTGFESNIYGPGKIRGILQIPKTDCYAVALDINMRGSGFEEDKRLQVNRNAIFCLIANGHKLSYIRRFYSQTEEFLIERLKAIASINHLNEDFCKKLRKDYNSFLNQLESDDTEIANDDAICFTLFEVGLLLSLPQQENITARVIMEHSTSGKNGLTFDEIRKKTRRKRNAEQLVIDSLLEKGLIVVIPPQTEKEEIRYIAH